MDWFWIALSVLLTIALVFGVICLYVAYEMIMAQERKAEK